MVYDLGRNVEICLYGDSFNASSTMVYLVLPYPLKVPLDKWVLGIGVCGKGAHFGKGRYKRQDKVIFCLVLAGVS
jgi:hypothetical protein